MKTDYIAEIGVEMRQCRVAMIGVLGWITCLWPLFAEGPTGRDLTDQSQLFETTQQAAEQGNAVAQQNLGVMYRDGVGVPQDMQQAVVWFRKAAEQGIASGQCNLGAMYAQGLGVAKDVQQAVMWFRKAAEQGQAEGQYNLGMMYANGQGVAKDDQKR